MASKKLKFDNTPEACNCKNACDRIKFKGRCPCLISELYCTELCNCGRKDRACINKSGLGGPLDEVYNVDGDGNEDENDHDDEEQVVLVANEDGFVEVRVEGLNRSLQDEENEIFEIHGVLDRTWQEEVQTTSPSLGLQIQNLGEVELRALLGRIFNDYPHLVAYVSGTDPEEPMDPEDPQPPADGQGQRWCRCGRCDPMPTAIEQKCCRRSNGQCELLTAGAQIQAVCLNLVVLVNAIRMRNDLFALQDEVDLNNNLRHCAYRQYVLWRFGHLGAGNRVVIPSCVVNKIRRTFPSDNGQYTGFRMNRFL